MICWDIEEVGEEAGTMRRSGKGNERGRREWKVSRQIRGEMGMGRI